MQPVTRHHAWIFISHASDDLVRVREVRNYLEANGASPLLFHLRALIEPEQFWPLIEREIAARNFFLYCDSEAAARSEWVKRERVAVAEVAKSKPVRIGSIRVDTSELDSVGLGDFVAKTRVFPSFPREDREQVKLFLDRLEEAGFQVLNPLGMSVAEVWELMNQEEVKLAARTGWVLAFFTTSLVHLHGSWFRREIAMTQSFGAKFIAVVLDRQVLPLLSPEVLVSITPKVFDATVDPANAPQRLVNEMLLRQA